MNRIKQCTQTGRYVQHTFRSVFTHQQVQQRANTAVKGMSSSTESSENAGAPEQARKYDKVKPVSEIPGPPKSNILGLIMFALVNNLKKDPPFDRNKMHKLWKNMFGMYGPIVKFENPFNPPTIITSDPKDSEMLTRVTMNNPVRFGLYSLSHIRKEAADNYFDKKAGLLTENHEEWKRVRSKVQTPMMKPKNVVAYLGKMDQVALDFMERLSELQKEHGEMPENFLHELYKWALESVSVVALSRRMGCLDPNLPKDSDPMALIREANNIFQYLNNLEISSLPLWRYIPTPSFIKLKKSHDVFLRIVHENINQTVAHLKARDTNSEEELSLMETLLSTPGLSEKDVVTLILDMLFAGIDTTSHTVGFVLYLLARNPQSQVKLQDEVDSVLGEYKGPMTKKHLADLHYLKAVIKEAMRLFPLTQGFARELQEDAVFSGYLVPKGYLVFSVNMVTARDEKVFPQANDFIPERWLRHQPLGKIHPYSTMSFGSGARMCIGRRIAEQEMYTLITRIMQRFTVDYKYQDMDIVTRLVSVPSEPLKFTFTERR